MDGWDSGFNARAWRRYGLTELKRAQAWRRMNYRKVGGRYRKTGMLFRCLPMLQRTVATPIIKGINQRNVVII